MGSHSSHREHFRARNDNRAAVRQAIGRRTRRRANHQSISLIGVQILPVDAGANGDHRSGVARQDGHVVEGIGSLAQRLSVGLHLNHGTVLHRIVIIVQSLHTCLNIVGSHIGQETQSAHVYTQNGYLLGTNPAGSLQKGAVASHRNGEVGLEIIARKDREIAFRRLQDAVHIAHLIDKMIIFLINEHTGTMHLQTGQHLLDGCRFLLLIEITKEGKCE